MLNKINANNILKFQFGGYAAESLADRMLDAKSSMLITTDAVWRGAKLVHLKDIADDGKLYSFFFLMNYIIFYIYFKFY